MFRRIFLFLAVNLLVVITLSLVLNLLSAFFGIQFGKGYMGMILMCSVFGMGGAFISLGISRWMAKRVYGIELIDANSRDMRLQAIYSMVSQLAKKNNLPMPEVGIYEAPEMNAFATGPSQKSSLVAFSTGIISGMNERELEAVAAHEMAHIANGDMVTMTLLTGVANAFVMFLARMIAGAINSFLRGDDEEGGGLGFFAYFILVSVLETLLMILAYIPIAYFSRYREFKADAGSAKVTSAGAMADALRRLGKAMDIETPKDSFSMAKISSSRRVSLWSTHPPLEERISRLTRGKA